MSRDKVQHHTVAICDPLDPENTFSPTLPNIAPVTPDDATDLTNPGILLIGTGGTLKINTVAGNTVTITVPAGYLMVPVSRVWSTGTTATGISVLYP